MEENSTIKGELSPDELVEIEDMIIVAMVRDPFCAIATTALLTQLCKEYDFYVEGHNLSRALYSLAGKHIIHKLGTKWAISTTNLHRRPMPPRKKTPAA